MFRSTRRRLAWVMPLMMLMAGSAVTLATPAPARADSPVVVYEGKLQDGKRKPVSGVYPLSFSFHKGPKGGKSLWSESHFVAIDNGVYVVELGAKRSLPPALDVERLFLGVSITGGDEIIREKIDPTSVRRDERQKAKAAAQGADDAANKKVVDYAETAGLAFEAEHAKVADKIGSLAEKDLLEKLKNAGSGVKIGSSKRYTSSAGGDGGVAYELKCPKGYVVTGVRGGSGIYLDSIQLICSPLE